MYSQFLKFDNKYIQLAILYIAPFLGGLYIFLASDFYISTIYIVAFIFLAASAFTKIKPLIYISLLFIAGFSYIVTYNIFYGTKTLSSEIGYITENMIITKHVSLDDSNKIYVKIKNNRYKDYTFSLKCSIKSCDDLKGGDEIYATVYVFKPYKHIYKYTINISKYSYIKGISGYGFVRSIKSIKTRGRAINLPILNEGYLLKPLKDYIDGDNMDIISSIITGNKGYLSKTLKENISNSGMMHIVAVSGLHIGIIYGIFFLIFRFIISATIGYYFRWNSRMVAAFAPFIPLLYYISIIGFPVSALRSLIMIFTGILWITLFSGRSIMAPMMMSFIAIVLYKPMIVAMPGFSMSFFATLILIIIFNSNYIQYKSISQNRFVNMIVMYCAYILLTSFMITLFLWPIIAIYFHKVSYIGLLSNVVIIPLLSFILMPSILMHYILDLVHLGGISGYIIARSSDLMLYVINNLGSYSYSHFYSINVSLVSIIIMFLCAIGSAYKDKRKYLYILIMAVYGMIANLPKHSEDLIIFKGDNIIAIEGDKLGSSRKSQDSFLLNIMHERFNINNSTESSACNDSGCLLNNVLVTNDRILAEDLYPDLRAVIDTSDPRYTKVLKEKDRYNCIENFCTLQFKSFNRIELKSRRMNSRPWF